MRYLICIVCVLFCASNASAACQNGHCRKPVRNLVKNTGKLVAAPFRCHCKNCKCGK